MTAPAVALRLDVFLRACSQNGRFVLITVEIARLLWNYTVFVGY